MRLRTTAWCEWYEDDVAEHCAEETSSNGLCYFSQRRRRGNAARHEMLKKGVCRFVPPLEFPKRLAVQQSTSVMPIQAGANAKRKALNALVDLVE